MGRPFFPLFFKDKKKLEYLSMEQRGELLTALFTYAEDGTLPTLDGVSGFAFEVFREGIDTSLDAYEETCRKNRENGKKGGRPKKNPAVSKKTERFSQETQNNPTKPNVTQKTEIEVEAEDRSRKQKIEDEERSMKYEAEDRSRGGKDTLAAAVKNKFNDLFGRLPSSEFLFSVRGTGLDVNIITLALQECKEKNISSPEAYATTILRRWAKDGIPEKYVYQTSGRQPTSDAPLADWEQDWIEEFRATQAKQEETND